MNVDKCKKGILKSALIMARKTKIICKPRSNKYLDPSVPTNNWNYVNCFKKIDF